MKKYEVTLTAHYEKTVSVFADSPEQAKAKLETVLFDTDLVEFTDDDFVCGEADINEIPEDGGKENADGNGRDEDDACSECPCFCLVCGECMCKGRN